MSKMPGPELLAEVEWQLDFGMHPIHISTVLQKTPVAIERAARRHGNERIRVIFQPVASQYRYEREGR
jgi:hypothetical protein